MINQLLKVVVQVIRNFHDILEVLHFLIKLSLGLYHLLVFLGDLFLFIGLFVFELLDLLLLELFLMVFFLNLGLHKQPLSKVVHRIVWLFFVDH